MITAINKTDEINFGIKISRETVRKANQACIERGKLAELQGLTIEEYNKLHKQDYVRKIGDRIYDFYAISKKIVADKENLKRAFSDAWKKVIG